MNFTEDYIKECNCKEIQDLKHGLEYGDWYSYKNEIYLNAKGYNAFTNRYVFKTKMCWLPTGDQLDKEIEKICDKDYCEYEIKRQYLPIKLPKFRKEWDATAYKIPAIRFSNSNPLIAKIKLLKELIVSMKKESDKK